eukprot:scaffold8730_cov28-Tisochrysis_lutea.AAC.1
MYVYAEVRSDHVVRVLNSMRGPWAVIYWQPSTGTLWFGRDFFGRVYGWKNDAVSMQKDVWNVRDKGRCGTLVPGIGMRWRRDGKDVELTHAYLERV